jgi:hypothetical protein
LGGQQQTIAELRARVREAEAEKQRLQAEVERLRTSSSAQVMARCSAHTWLYKSGWVTSLLSAVQDGVVSSTSKLEESLRALDDKVRATDDTACFVLLEL